MELKNIGINNYKRSNLLMTRGCDNRNIANAVFLSSFVDRNNQSVDSGSLNANVRTLNSSSIYPIVNTTTTTPSTSKGPDYVPMAPIKSSDKISTEQSLITKSNSELTNFHKESSLPSDEGEYYTYY